ncbi:MAG: ion transporter [Methylococcales bacterium]|jgi:voltage-gated potassium channel|nr:ion transporter [Methylococcales bacterium]MBT7442855.1 ion transporter [Methylococcales bacterium]
MAHRDRFGRPDTPWRAKGYDIIFGTDSRAGQLFDEILLVCIIASVLAVMLDSVQSIRSSYSQWLNFAEWFFTIIFTIEYITRLMLVKNKLKYVFSFYGVVDFLSIMPTYLGLLYPGTQYLLIIRVLRVLRVFRVLKLAQYLGEANTLMKAMAGSKRKVIVFLFTVSTIVIIFGSMMYLIEGEENGFSSIPISIYWAIVTITTVGYGDMYPSTDLGRALAACTMIIGYAIIAVPTGIFTAELTHVIRNKKDSRECTGCQKHGHDENAHYCVKCGTALP